MKKTNRAIVAAMASLVCLGIALFQLYLGLQVGGFPPETVVFGLLALIFALVWWTSRPRT